MEVKTLFLRPKPAKMLVLLKEEGNPKYASQVSKGADCTYSHTFKVLNKFQKLGLVEFEKRGRVKLIRLTERGIEIAHDLEGLLRKLESIEEEPKKKRKKKKEEKLEKRLKEKSKK